MVGKASKHAYIEQVSLVSSVRNETDSKTLLPGRYGSRRGNNARKGLFSSKKKKIPDVAVNPTEEESLATGFEPSIGGWRLLCCWKQPRLAHLSPSIDSSLTSFPAFGGKRFPPLASVEYPAEPSYPSQNRINAKPKPKAPQFSPEEENWSHQVHHLRDWSPISQPKAFSGLTQSPEASSFCFSPSPKVCHLRTAEANQDFPRKRSPKPPRLQSASATQSAKSEDPVMAFRRRSSPAASRSGSEASSGSDNTDLNEKILLQSSPIFSPPSRSEAKRYCNAHHVRGTSPRDRRVTSPRDKAIESDFASPKAYSANNSVFTPDFVHPQPHVDPLVEQNKNEYWSPQLVRDRSPERPRGLSPDHSPEKRGASDTSRIMSPDPSTRFDVTPTKHPFLEDWSPNTEWTTPSALWFDDGGSTNSWTSPAAVKVCCKCNTEFDVRDFDGHDHAEWNRVSPFVIQPEKSRASIPRGSLEKIGKKVTSGMSGQQRKLFSPDSKPIIAPEDMSASGLVSIDSLLASYWDPDESAKSPVTPLTSNRYAEHLDFLQTRVTDK